MLTAIPIADKDLEVRREACGWAPHELTGLGADLQRRWQANPDRCFWSHRCRSLLSLPEGRGSVPEMKLRSQAWHVREDLLVDGGPVIAVDRLMPISRLG